jgi:hypothetical protein
MCPIQFQSHLVSWTFLMAYSKTKLKSSGDRSSPCFRPFWIGNLSDKCLPIWTLLYVSFKHILINLTTYIHGYLKLYETAVQYFPPHWIIVFSWSTASLFFHFFSSIWRMQKIWSVVDMLHRNPQWWSPTLSSMYGLNLEGRIFYKYCMKLTAAISHDNYY